MNEESQNLNETTESVPSFLQEGLDHNESTQSVKPPKKKKDPEDIFNQDSSDSDEEDEEAAPSNQGGMNYAYHRGLYTLNVAEKVTQGRFLPVTMLIEEGLVEAFPCSRAPVLQSIN